ncbi:EFR1 family ferrodoxin [bacterium]|nr:EFR1 family ferrodoxin [bacterium]
MTFQKAQFYILSGTGNTFRVAHWMKEMLEDQNIPVTLDMIDDVDPDSQLEKPHEDLVGLFFPTHGFMPPWSMIKFLLCFPRRKKTPAICVATRGSIFLGPVRIPGAAGFATFFAALILTLKGYRVKGIFSLDMPSNMINLHWGLHTKNVEKIRRKTRQRLRLIVARLTEGKRIWFSRNNLWEAIWSVVLFWFVPIFPILYLLFGKMFMGKMMFSNNRCVGCGLCAKSCPNSGIRMVRFGKRAYPFWTYHCENCMRCMAYCRRKAVEAGHSWAVALFYLTSVPLVFWISVWLHQQFPWIPRINNYWVNELLNIFYFLPALIISYRIFWYLIRFRPLNTLFTYTTITRYLRRYHEPETKLKQMTLLARKRKLLDDPVKDWNSVDKMI